MSQFHNQPKTSRDTDAASVVIMAIILAALAVSFLYELYIYGGIPQ